MCRLFALRWTLSFLPPSLPSSLPSFLPHMEIPRLGIKLELQLPAYITATATLYLSCICNLRPGLWWHRILNPLSEARNQNNVLKDTHGVLNPLGHNGNAKVNFLLKGFSVEWYCCVFWQLLWTRRVTQTPPVSVTSAWGGDDRAAHTAWLGGCKTAPSMNTTNTIAITNKV